MDMERLAYEVKAELEDHFAVCKAEETRRFGTTSKYSSMALHTTGRIPFPSAAASDAVNAERSVENRARQAVAA